MKSNQHLREWLKKTNSPCHKRLIKLANGKHLACHASNPYSRSFKSCHMWWCYKKGGFLKYFGMLWPEKVSWNDANSISNGHRCVSSSTYSNRLPAESSLGKVVRNMKHRIPAIGSTPTLASFFWMAKGVGWTRGDNRLHTTRQYCSSARMHHSPPGKSGFQVFHHAAMLWKNPSINS